MWFSVGDSEGSATPGLQFDDGNGGSTQRSGPVLDEAKAPIQRHGSLVACRRDDREDGVRSLAQRVAQKGPRDALALLPGVNDEDRDVDLAGLVVLPSATTPSSTPARFAPMKSRALCRMPSSV